MRRADYDEIAKYYDSVIGAGFEIKDYLKDIIRKYNKDVRSVLELGCGTGENLRYFSSKFKLTGIDISSEMLKIAKKKNPNADFQLKDIRSFRFKSKFDLIICLYDTINHIPLFNDWKKLFAGTSEHLEKNGLFVFDMNTLCKMEYFTSISPVVHKFGQNYLIVTVHKIFRNTFNWNIKVFDSTKKNNFKLTEANIKESSFEADRVKAVLEKYFHVLKFEDDTGREYKADSGRIFFVCRKKQ